MGMNGYMDEQLDVMGDGLFDDIDEFFNFSNDDEISQVEGSDVDSAHLPSLPNVIAAPFTSSNGEGSQVVPIPEEAKICDELNTSEDWINNFLDENPFYDTDFNTTAAIAVKDDRIFKEEPQFQSLSPVSVLEPSNIVNSENKDIISSSSSSSSSSSFSSITTNNNNSSSSSSNNNNNNKADAFSVVVVPVGPTTMSVPARARSKRPRHVAIPILPPEAPPAIPTLLLPECESFIEESCPIVLAPPPMKKKKKMGLPAVAAGANQEEAPAPRKCLHCGIQKTPQWRAGPMGPKTLCNACGVRYKSGRLFPEYRPAASPTFVPAIHSNSHKKVVELRNKACQEKAANGMPSPEYPAAKNCDLLEYIRRRD